MIVRLVSLLFLATAAKASTTTTVSVLEFGKGGAVRRTTSTDTTASVHGVTSFWAHLHDMDAHGRRPKNAQTSGMNMVPDLFQKSNGGLILSVTGLQEEDLQSMNTLNSILDAKDSENNVVGQFHLPGAKAKSLLGKSVETFDSNEFGAKLEESVKEVISSPEAENKVRTVSLHLDNNSASTIDKHLSSMLKNLETSGADSGSTYLVHLVVEQDNKVDLAERQGHRRLEEVEGEDDQEATGKDKIYYGYGYFDENGNYYSPYRTIFEIQHFQINLWAALGLFGGILIAMGKMINMDLIPDTLLFGESAKME